MQEMINENLYTCSLSCIELSLWNALWNVKKENQQKSKKKKPKQKPQVSIKLIDIK